MNQYIRNAVTGKIMLAFLGFVFVLSVLVFLKQLVSINQNPYEDFPIFYAAIQQYVDSGVLYTRHLDYYYPASGIYKFPALYGNFLLPLVKNHISLDLAQTILLCLHVALYITSIVILVFLWIPGQQRVLFGLLSGIISLNLYPLHETLRTLQLEMYILFFISLMLLLLNKQRYFFTAAVFAFISLLKIYPVFMGIFFLWKRKAAFFTGFVLASLLLLGWMVVCFGWTENQWYFFSALPVMLQEGTFINHHNVGVEKLINHIFSTSQFIHYETVIGVGSVAITKIILWAFCFLGLWGFFRKANVQGSRAIHPHYMAFSLLLTLAILTLKNPWSNYQVLLVVPLLYILSRLLVLSQTKIISGIFIVAYLLLFIAPTHRSVFFTVFKDIAHPVLMYVLTILNDKFFAFRGAATILVYIMLLCLLFRKDKPAHE